MFLKAAFKNSSVFVQLLMLLAVSFFCLMISSFFSSLLVFSKLGISPEAIQEVQNLANHPDLLREMQFMQVLGIFIFPPIICAWLFSDNYKEYLRIETPIQLPVAAWTVVSMIVFIPVVNFTSDLNQQMVFPESLKGVETWMTEMETALNQQLESMLATHNGWVILFNILTVCVLSGIGEEFMFRGLLQNMFGRFFKNPHLLVWLIAFLFSTIHFQFYGFLPRLLLGAYLGYLMYYTKTIWIPALAHFTNNFYSLAVFYIFQDSPEYVQQADTLGTGSTWWLSAASLALFYFCFSQIKKISRKSFITTPG
jgi:membrane protease YdiL (CAAX protease family)